MPSADPIRLILADDHMVVRTGLRQVLESDPGLVVVDEAESGEAVLYLCQKLKPDVVLMDVQMEGISGIEATRLLVLHHPGVKVIGLSTFADPKVVKDMISAGACGYLLKDVSAPELVQAIRHVQAGETVFSRNLSPTLEAPEADESAVDEIDTNIVMGAQQKRVLALLTKGLTNPEIAAHMGVSLPTARYHVSAILQKLEVSNRVEAVALAIRLGLTSESDF